MHQWANYRMYIYNPLVTLVMAKMRKPQNVQKSSKGSIQAIKRLRRHLDFLSLLSKAKTGKQRCLVLQMASVEHVRTVCECIKNVMNKKVPGITEKDKKFFHKYRNAIKKLTSSNMSMHSRHKILAHEGAFLPNVLAPILATASSVNGSPVNEDVMDMEAIPLVLAQWYPFQNPPSKINSRSEHEHDDRCDEEGE